MIQNSNAHQAKLQVAQQAIASLLGNFLPVECEITPKTESLRKAEEILNLENAKIGFLELVFDRIHLDTFKHQDIRHYLPLQAITNHPPIPYPHKTQPEKSIFDYQKEVADQVGLYLQNTNHWHDSNFLFFILEKYGACVSYGNNHVALLDAARITSAIATLIEANPLHKNLSLIAGDLSGIQKFIYTISSDGALKSLRARSFYLELVTEEIAQQVLQKFHLPRTNVIYAGGGNLFILAEEDICEPLEELQKEINKRLKDTFQGKISLALTSAACDLEGVGTVDFRNCWNQAIANINKQKERKFENSINDLLKRRNSHQPCKVCHRDDIKPERLQPLHNESDVLACPTCRRMFRLGGQLFKVKAFIRSNRNTFTGSLDRLNLLGYRYYLFENIPDPETIKSDETLFLINDWELKHYGFANAKLMLLGNYSQQGEKGFITAEEMTAVADGVPRVGYLRMDVDRLGQIFAGGLSPEEYSLTRIAGLSRQMSYFFKVYLNSLANNRAENLPVEPEILTKRTDENFSRKNLLFIYAGGDDLFISGAWNEVVEFAFDVYQSFRAYSGHNPSITISGGISLEDAKFPLYQAADLSGEAEEKAKRNDRDSLGLFMQAFKWEEWLGKDAKSIVNNILKSDENYWKSEQSSPNMAGVLPFVRKLKDEDISYSRSFVRNLLKAAQLQEQKIKEIRDRNPKNQYNNEEKDIRYYLHLPQIAYMLSRLSKDLLNDDDFRQSLKSPYNAPYFRAIATWIELLNRRGTIE